MYKKAVFLGECMIELSGDISSLDKFSSNMQVNFGGDAYNSSVYFSRLVNKEVSTFFSTALSKDTFSRKKPTWFIFYRNQQKWRKKFFLLA